jgi:hypothetical protein
MRHAHDLPRLRLGLVDQINGVRIHPRDGAAIKDVDIVTITAIEDADMVDIL